MAQLAQLLRLAGLVAFFVIAIGIALVALDANEDSDVVRIWLDVSRWLVQPFRDIFDLERGKEHLQIAINWGIAAIVYAVVGALLGRLVERLARSAPARLRGRRA
jgi:hypothetical protein